MAGGLKRMTKSLCWTCDNTDICPWVKEGRPIDGCISELKKVNDYTSKYRTSIYLQHLYCPKYKGKTVHNLKIRDIAELHDRAIYYDNYETERGNYTKQRKNIHQKQGHEPIIKQCLSFFEDGQVHTSKELQDALFIKPDTAKKYLHRLIDDGKIECLDNRYARGKPKHYIKVVENENR